MTEAGNPKKKPDPWLMALIPIAVGAILLKLGFAYIQHSLAEDQRGPGLGSVDEEATAWAGAAAEDCGEFDAAAPVPAVVDCVESAAAGAQPFLATLSVGSTRHVLAGNSQGEILRLSADPFSDETRVGSCDQVVTTREGRRGLWCRDELVNGEALWFPQD